MANDIIGLDLLGPEDATQRLLDMEEERFKEDMGVGEAIEEPSYSMLTGTIMNQFETNRQAKQNSGMEDEIFESIRANNGEYNPEDLARIQDEGGSAIYMNLSATKIRAAQSWIKDILLSANADAYSIEPTPIPALPGDLEKDLEEAFKAEYENTKAKMQQQASQQGASISPQDAQDTILEINRRKRDIKEAVLDELNTESVYQMSIMEKEIKDDMAEGNWEKALDDFIEDFCTFPTAFMKGPVIQKKEKMVWDKGEPIVREQYCFTNKRVNPMDVYPEPSATCIQEGNFIEHLRLSASEVYGMKGLPGYFPDAIDKVLEAGPVSFLFNSNVEYEKAEEEKRGNTHEANKGVYHALHYWGTAKTEEVAELGLVSPDEDPQKVWEIEAILINNEIVRCKLNDDPLKRRPYYKASYQNIPGSFWGRSLPNLMRDIQRMCNACARALANNMGLAAGPQVEINIERLADSGEIEELKPLKIWQVTGDPTGGAGGRAIQFFQVPSIANELMAVYDKFEQKADDATGIPRYSYGNEKVGGAAQTMGGLSMLLESATKSIKDAIRHIDEGLIRPRIEYQFYWHLLRKDTEYTGDINVITHGSDTLTLKGAQQAKRQEFLQITANEIDQKIMGPEGRAELIREMAKDLNLTTQIVPSRLELKKQQEEEKQMQQQMMQQEAQKTSAGVQSVQLQTQSAEKIANQRNQLEVAKIQQDGKKHSDNMNIEVAKLDQSRNNSAMKAMSDARSDQTKMNIARTNASVAIAKE